MSRSKGMWLGAALGVLVLAVVACGGDSAQEDSTGTANTAAADADFEMTIGDLVPLTGDLSAFGPPGQKAADLAVEEVSSALSGVGGEVQIDIDHADTETRPQSAVSAARKLISDGSTCVAGAWASANTIPVGKSVATRRQVPLISPASTSAEITDLDDDGYVWRTAPSDNLQAVALADVMEEKLGGTDQTVSIAGRNDAYGEGLAQGVKQEWESRGGQTSGPVLYDPEQSQYNSEASQIVSNNPDAYVVVDFPETYQKMGAALARTDGFDPSKLFVTDGLAVDDLEEKDIPTDSIDGATGTRPGTPESGQAAQAFNKLYKESNQTPDERQTFDAQNFDAVILCALAAVAAGSEEGVKIKDKLADVSRPPGDKFTYTQLEDALRALRDGNDIDYDGASGPIDFDDNGDPSAATYDVFSYQDGQLEVQRQTEASK